MAISAIINGTFNNTEYPVLAVMDEPDKQITDETKDDFLIPFAFLKEIYILHCDHVYHRENNFKNGTLSFPTEDAYIRSNKERAKRDVERVKRDVERAKRDAERAKRAAEREARHKAIKS